MLLPVLPACGESPRSGSSDEKADPARAGALSMQLGTELNGVRYRLRDAIFEVTGPEPATIDTEEDPGAPVIQRTLQAGDYSIDLQDGWRLEKELADGFHTVAAELVTMDPRAFGIVDGGTTNLAYGFLTDGAIVGLGEGDLSLTIEVIDRSNPGGDLVGNLDGRLIQMPCADTPTTDDCRVSAIVDGALQECVNSRLDIVLDHPIGGEAGASYLATLHFYGIVEPKNYGNNQRRESGNVRPMNLATGATPPPWYIGVPGQVFIQSTFASYEIRVFDQNGVETGTYFANSDLQEGHFTYVLDFERTIPIVGGGMVRLRMFDANCRMIKNCGATAGFPCAQKVRIVDTSAADPQPAMGPPPGGFDQPGLGQTPDQAGQWFLIDVTNVVAQ